MLLIRSAQPMFENGKVTPVVRARCSNRPTPVASGSSWVEQDRALRRQLSQTDPCFSDDGTHFADVGLDHAREFLNGTCHRLQTLVAVPCLNVRRLHGDFNLLIELRHHSLGRTGRCENAEPLRNYCTRKAGLNHRRYRGGSARALLARDC